MITKDEFIEMYREVMVEKRVRSSWKEMISQRKMAGYYTVKLLKGGKIKRPVIEKVGEKYIWKVYKGRKIYDSGMVNTLKEAESVVMDHVENMKEETGVSHGDK